ncbi:MAG TPA: hypothetical protein VLE20_03505 [Blastocatellia bacterium]|jgi:hypothetical protein|nr:hypothetical protein [Blastocatellia bacterium]
MKRALFIAVAVSFLFALACKQPGKVSTYPGPSPTPPQTVESDEKLVTIRIITFGGRAVIVDPGDVDLKKNRQKAKWCVRYEGPVNQARIVVDDFRDTKGTPPGSRNPFGDHSGADNVFDFGPFNAGGEDCTKLSKVGTTSGYYYYRIIVLAADGKVLAERDPGVIIAD